MNPNDAHLLSAEGRLQEFAYEVQALSNRYGVAVRGDLWLTSKHSVGLPVVYLVQGRSLECLLVEGPPPPVLDDPSTPLAEVLHRLTGFGLHFDSLEKALGDSAAYRTDEHKDVLLVIGKEYYLPEPAETALLYGAGATLIEIDWEDVSGGLLPNLYTFHPWDVVPPPSEVPENRGEQFVARLGKITRRWGVLLWGEIRALERPGFVYRVDGRRLEYTPIWPQKEALAALEPLFGTVEDALTAHLEWSSGHDETRLILCTEGMFALITPEQARQFPNHAIWEVQWLGEAPPLLRSYFA